MSGYVERRLLRRCDWLLLAFVAGLCAVSLPVLYSATLGTGGDPAWYYVQRQALWMLIGLAGLLLVNTLDHHDFPDLARGAYWLSIALLVMVLVAGREVNGARSWLGLGSVRLQPSELAKLTVVLALARHFTLDEAEAGEAKVLFGSLMAVGLPLVLILCQPDLGTALVFVGVWLVMLWWGGARWWQLALIVGLGLAAFALMWRMDVLADYQKSRVSVLFNPGVDPRGQGYNLRQCLIAIGSGGIDGQGWLQGTQTHLRFLPEARTDFIFAVLCEELGLRGALLLLLLYLGLLWRGGVIVARADTPFGRHVAVGCLAVLLLHLVFNLGMAVGLLPITGLPLPFISYGGSNLLLNLTLVGVLLNIGMRRSLPY